MAGSKNYCRLPIGHAPNGGVVRGSFFACRNKTGYFDKLCERFSQFERFCIYCFAGYNTGAVKE